ncbi:MAG: hypothetical protein LQ338_002653 [Usnochroma carphineum]|nr:MAG: hypothetical protein LQ338_002653 [Usnochroma carphineum]
MVLEASLTSDYDDAFSDTPDPYGSDPQTSVDSMNIDRAQLPKPLPVIGPLFGFSQTSMSTAAAERIQYHSKLLGRSITRNESEALMYHSYKSIAITSYGIPIILGLGISRAYTTRDIYRLPLYGPLKTEDGFWNGERIRIMGLNVLEGPYARIGVHLFRGSVYGLLAYVSGVLFVSSYATTVAAVGELRDPRLRNLQQEVIVKRKQQMGNTEPMKQPRDPMGQGNTSAADLWKRHREGIEGQDDASPSAGTEYYGGDMGRIGGTNTGILSDSQMRTQEAMQQASPRESPAENRASTFRIEKVDRQPASFGDDFDDASSTAQSRADDGQGGNAWDRIRRQAQRQASGTKQGGRGWDAIRKEQQEGSTAGDSFTFSSADEERQLAQDEAQKEFDARVERERRGGNFDENRGRRW